MHSPEQVRVGPTRRDLAWLFSERLLRLFVTFIVLALAARVFGPDGFGSFAFATAMTGIITNFCALGIKQVALIRVIQHPSTALQTITTIAANQCLVSFLCIGLVLCLTTLTSVIDQRAADILSILILSVTFSFHLAFIYWLESQGCAGLIAQRQIVAIVISFPLKAFAILKLQSLLWLAFFVTTEQAFLAFSLLSVARSRGFIYASFKVAFIRSVETLKESLPHLLSASLTIFIFKAPQLFLTSLRSDYEGGLYSAAAAISEAAYTLPMVLTTLYFPSLIKKWATKGSNFTAVHCYLRDLLVINLMATLAIAFAADILITFAYGPTYASAANTLTLHAFTIPFIAMSLVTSRILLINKLEHHTLYRNIAGAMIVTITSVIFIPVYGLIGAAGCSLFTTFVIYYLYDLCFTETRFIFIANNRAIGAGPKRVIEMTRKVALLIRKFR